jgi:uncharacterized repeat protein (TIGR01451 family)
MHPLPRSPDLRHVPRGVGMIAMALFTVLLLLGHGAMQPEVATAQQGRGPYVSPPVKPVVFDKDLRTLPKAPPGRTDRPAREVPLGIQSQPSSPTGTSSPGSGGSLIPGQPANPTSASVTPAEFLNPNPNFAGIGYTGLVPPDPVGDVGPNHYIQAVNAQFQVFDKQGTSLAGPANINTLWSSLPNDPCFQNNNGDPYVLYDHLADRWVISQFAVPNGFNNPPTWQCIAVSRTGNPVTGGWYLYTFQFNFGHDYPKMGVWPDGYYMSSQQGFSGGSLNAVVFDRANMLNGNPATFQAFTLAPPALILLPSDLDGPPPPPGTPNFFARHVDGGLWGGVDRVEIYALSVNWQNPAASTFTSVASLNTVAFDSNLCAGQNLNDNCVPQPNTNVLLETLPHWAMGPLQYRNFGTYETLVFNHTVDVDGNDHAGIRWYELRRPSGGAWSIYQQGTFSPDAGAPGLADDPHRWMGSIAMDKAGNIALGYSASSSTLFPEIRYAGRLASDPLGLLPHGEVTLVAGGNSQIINGSRWGDYSAMRVDPADGCTFWYTTQYIAGGEPFGTGNGGAWATRIGAFRFPTCNPADLSITKVDRPDPVSAGQSLFYDVTVTNNGPDAATNVVVTDVLPNGVTYVTSTIPCTATPPPPTERTCTIGTLAAGASSTFTIEVKVDPSLLVSTGGSTSITNSAAVTATQLDPNTANNTATATTVVNELADLRVLKECKPDQPNKQPAGTETFCEIYVDNLGPSDARTVVVTDRIISTTPITITAITSTTTTGTPATCPATPISPTTATTLTCTDTVLPAGARDTIKVTFKANDAGDVDDTASVSSATPDPTTANNTAVGRVSFSAVSDLVLAKSDTPDPVIAGMNLTYTLMVTNNGPSAAANVVVHDVLPKQVSFVSATPSQGSCQSGVVPGDPAKPLTCTLGTLASGASAATVTVVVKVNADVPAGTILVNNADVSSDSTDPDTSNNVRTATTTVNTSADVAIDKTSDAATYKPSTQVKYQITVTNNGPSKALNVVVTDNLPDIKQAIYQSDTGGCVFSTPTTLVCNLGDLAVGQSKTFFIYVTIKGAQGTVSNTASVASSTPDPTPGNNTSTRQVTIKGKA